MVADLLPSRPVDLHEMSARIAEMLDEAIPVVGRR
jgi:hypothetical protein